MSRTLSRSALSSSSAYQHGYMQPNLHGGGFFDAIKKGIQWAKDNKVASKLGAAAQAVGATDFLDAKTGGKFSQGLEMAKNQGFGRRRRAPRKATSGGRRKVGRPRKTAGSKTAISGGRRRTVRRR